MKLFFSGTPFECKEVILPVLVYLSFKSASRTTFSLGFSSRSSRASFFIRVFESGVFHVFGSADQSDSCIILHLVYSVNFQPFDTTYCICRSSCCTSSPRSDAVVFVTERHVARPKNRYICRFDRQKGDFSFLTKSAKTAIRIRSVVGE